MWPKPFLAVGVGHFSPRRIHKGELSPGVSKSGQLFFVKLTPLGGGYITLEHAHSIRGGLSPNPDVEQGLKLRSLR